MLNTCVAAAAPALPLPPAQGRDPPGLKKPPCWRGSRTRAGGWAGGGARAFPNRLIREDKAPLLVLLAPPAQGCSEKSCARSCFQLLRGGSAVQVLVDVGVC